MFTGALRNAAVGAALYGGVLVAIGAATGVGLDLMPNAISGVIMGAAIMADDYTHTLLEVDASLASSAVVTGAWFAGMEAVLRGDMRLARNAAAGAVTGTVVSTMF
jgi:hypothetical protein